MEFFDSARSALDRMAEVSFDVMVTDMQMPEMNGAALINETRRRHPATVRLILSGHADRDLIMECVGSAHQCLSKPCDPELLKITVSRAACLQRTLQNESLTEQLTRLDRLPSVPALYTEIVQRLKSPEVTMDALAEVVAKDAAMTASVLKLANSAFFGLGRTLVDPAEAISYLGSDVLQGLVVSHHIFQYCTPLAGDESFLDDLMAHSTRVSSLAGLIARAEAVPNAQIGEILISGLLHDVGRLILAAVYPKAYFLVRQRREPTISLGSREVQVFGATHAEVGGYLLGLWGLPDPVVDAVTFHHHPVAGNNTGFTPLTAVHVAESLLEKEGGEGEGMCFPYLDSLEMTHRVPEWEDLLGSVAVA